MWQNHYTSLRIEGKDYTREQLLLKANSVLKETNSPEWEKQFWNFIVKWLDEKDTVIVRTSGSTGTPKAIHISKQNMIHSATATGQYFNFQKHQKALLCLPCEYIAGKMMALRALVWELDLYIHPPNQPLDGQMFFDFSAMVPLQVEKLIQENKEGLNNIHQLIIGGAPISYSLLEKIKELSTQCYATYGMTETITHIAIKPLNHHQARERYHCLPKVEISKDERGCLVIHAPGITAQSVVTNDIVNIVNANSFEWLGRIDNVINSGGVKVFPEVVEQKLARFISRRFFITALPHPSLGEQVVLVIEQQKVAERINWDNVLTNFEKPKQILSVPQFIETPNGKIKRKATLDFAKRISI